MNVISARQTENSLTLVDRDNPKANITATAVDVSDWR